MSNVGVYRKSRLEKNQRVRYQRVLTVVVQAEAKIEGTEHAVHPL